MVMTRRNFSLAVAGSSLATLAGCALLKNPGNNPTPPNQVVAYIQAIIGAAENAIGLIGTTVGLSPVLTSQVSAYLSSVGTAVQDVITALNAGSILSRVDAFVMALAKLSATQPFTSLLPGPVALIIQGVAMAIDAFVKFLPVPAPGAPHISVKPVGATASALTVLYKRATAVVTNAKSLPLVAAKAH